MIQDVVVEIQLHNSILKKTAKGWSMSQKEYKAKKKQNFIAKWQLMKCSGKYVAMGYLARCQTNEFFFGQAKMKCNLSDMTSSQKS